MNTQPPHPRSLDAAPLGRRSPCLVVDLGLSCPACHVQLTLPSAYLGQVVTGPCPECGWTLVFCHGCLESAPTPVGTGPLIDLPVPDRPTPALRTKLPRTGTVGAHYLDVSAIHGDGGEAAWGGIAAPREDPAGTLVEAVPAARGFRWGWLAVVAVVLVGGVVWVFSRPVPPLPSPRLASPGSGDGGPRTVTAGWGEGALAAWQAFGRAATAEEKLAHVLGAERVAPALRAFYTAHPGSDEKWVAREFKPLAGTTEDRRRGQLALGSSPKSRDERPIILFFRTETPEAGAAHDGEGAPRFRLDWETYIQEREGLVESFLNEADSTRRTFRLAIERVHIFDESGPSPGRAEPLGLKLRTPSGLILPQVAAVRTDSALYARLDGQLRWGMPAYATVQLVWEATPGTSPRVIATDLVCWHFPGLGGTPEFEVDLSPLPPTRP